MSGRIRNGLYGRVQENLPGRRTVKYIGGNWGYQYTIAAPLLNWGFMGKVRTAVDAPRGWPKPPKP